MALASATRDDLGLHAEVAGAAADQVQRIHLALVGGQHQAAVRVQAAGLAGQRLELAIEVDRVFLQARDVGVAVERVHAAGRVPGRAGGQLALLEQHDVGPADLGQMVEDADPDDAAADHHRPSFGPHALPRSAPRQPMTDARRTEGNVERRLALRPGATTSDRPHRNRSGADHDLSWPAVENNSWSRRDDIVDRAAVLGEDLDIHAHAGNQRNSPRPRPSSVERAARTVIGNWRLPVFCASLSSRYSPSSEEDWTVGLPCSGSASLAISVTVPSIDP